MDSGVCLTMCELLLRVVDKINRDDPRLDSKCTKRGDVIVAVDDGWSWSPAERTNPDWRIIRLPNVTLSEAQSFLAPEPEDTPETPSPFRQRRAFRFDADSPALPAAFATWLADASRAQPARTVNYDWSQLAALRKRVAAIARIDVL